MPNIENKVNEQIYRTRRCQTKFVAQLDKRIFNE